VTAPALPAGWVTGGDGDGTLWVTSTITPDTAPNDAFITDQDGISDKYLITPGIIITSASAVLSFRNNFNTEHDPPPAEVFWDGGVLEVSSPNFNNGDWTDITDPVVGGSFVTGGYTGEISGIANNPLAGRMAWSGNSGGYINTVVNLGPNVNGRTIRLRFRMGTDEAVAAPGWRIDTMTMVGGGACASPTPTATATATVTGSPIPTPILTPTPTPIPTTTPCSGTAFPENFDGVTAPALPAGWTTSGSGDGVLWVTSINTPDTAPNDAFVTDQDGISDKSLYTPLFTVTSASAQLSFRNNFNTEHDPPPAEVFWDGGVLEVSSININLGNFTDITDPAVGGNFVIGGYTGEIDGTANNPLAGRMAWSGDSGGYINTVVNLGPNVNGQTIQLRFRMGTDEAVAAPGWRIDTMAMVGGGTCASPTPGATPTATATSTPCGGANVIADGTFEAGTPWTAWTVQTSTNFGTPLCDITSCGTGGGASPPFAGNNWAWFGGVAAPETATAGQTVTIPSGGSASLTFQMRIGTVTTPFTDVLNVRVDGTIVQSYPEPAVAEADYTLRTISLNAFANGAPHQILFEYIGPSSGTGSYVVDDVSLIASGACPSATPTATGTPSATPTATATATATATVVPSATPTPTPGCPWSFGANFPAVGGVRAVGNYFPANGRFYAMGGRSADVAGADFTNPFEYNPGPNTWATRSATYPDNKINNMACGVLTVEGTPQIYCVGGNASQVVGTASRVFSYNPVTDTVTVLTAADNWPGSQSGGFLPGGFAVAGNKLYIIGSFNANSVPPVVTGQVWQFDPNAAVGSRWLQRLDCPVARAYVPAATIGGLIYTAGGSNVDAAGVLIDSTDSFKYDPVANAWTAIANIPRATGETRAVVINNQIWVLGGGRVAPNPSNQVNIYTPGSNTWTIGVSFITARRNFPADSDGSSRLWLAGGYDSSGTTLLNTTEVYGLPCP
jgi:hypothetical protein